MKDNEIIQEATEAVTKGYPCAFYVPQLLEVIKNKEAEIEKKDTEIEILIRKKEALRDEISGLTAEIERLKNLVETMSDYFPACINCEGKTPLGERTDKCVYLIDDTEYCTKRGIENIAHIVKENKSQKAEIDRLRHILVNFMGEIFDWGNKNGVDTKIFAQTAILGKEKDGAVKQIKSEAYREFALDLKCGVPQETGVIRCADVDNTLSELTRNLHGTCTETTNHTATNQSVSLIDGHIEG